MKRIPILSLLAMVATSCKSEDFFTKEIPELKGKTEAALITRWGRPEMVATNTVGAYAKSAEPFKPVVKRVLSIYPTNQPANLSVPIKVLSWTKDRIRYTANLQQTNGNWRVIYAEKWNMDVME
jgi:hypothetical protein